MKPCPYCGNNPVPHRLYWQQESLNILFTPLRQEILYSRPARFFKGKIRGDKLALFFCKIGEKLKIISRQKDIAKCKVRRAQVLWEEAEKRGIVMQELLLFGRPFDCYWAQKLGNKDIGKLGTSLTIIFSGLPRPAGYINHRLDLMDDKWLFKRMMMENGLPVPMGGSCSSFKQAIRVLREIQDTRYKVLDTQDGLVPSTSNLVSIIVKPRAGSRGRHSTTFVSSPEDLKKAFNIAKQLCYWVMVEQQLTGPVYRATVINFELAGVLRGDPPQIMGDGIKTIGQLIEAKNQGPHLGVKNVVIDGSMELFLSRQSLSLSSVAAKGQIINLSEKIGVNYGGSSSEDFEICHSDNKELFVKAAKILGDPIVGFDFIIPDITISYKQQKCGFIEVNSLPFINLHHDPLHGQARNVAAKVWDLINW